MGKFSLLIHIRRETFLHLIALVLFSFLLLILPQKIKVDLSALVFRFTYGPFYAFSNHIKKLEGVREENQTLHQKVMELSLRNFRLNEEHLENQRLRELLGFRSQLEHQVIPADVIATDPNRTYFSVLINKGTLQGMKKNMPVVNMRGLVGKIVGVSSSSSVVQLMIDPSFRASALDKRSRVFGIIKPQTGFTLRLDNVPLQEDVQVGDQVISSGLGGIFPPGLQIGVVTAVESEETFSKEDRSFGIFKMIQVKPSVDFSSLEELFVLDVVRGEEEKRPDRDESH
jgi:rod shape-determining protein MreC